VQSLVTNSVGAVCAAVTVPRLRSMKGFRSGVCNVAVPGTDCHAGQGQGRLGRNREGWRQASTEPQACALPSKTSRQGEHAAGGSSATTWMR